MLDLLSGDNEAGDRYNPTGAARPACLSLDNAATNAKKVYVRGVNRWVGQRCGVFSGQVA